MADPIQWGPYSGAIGGYEQIQPGAAPAATQPTPYPQTGDPAQPVSQIAQMETGLQQDPATVASQEPSWMSDFGSLFPPGTDTGAAQVGGITGAPTGSQATSYSTDAAAAGGGAAPGGAGGAGTAKAKATAPGGGTAVGYPAVPGSQADARARMAALAGIPGQALAPPQFADPTQAFQNMFSRMLTNQQSRLAQEAAATGRAGSAPLAYEQSQMFQRAGETAGEALAHTISQQNAYQMDVYRGQLQQQMQQLDLQLKMIEAMMRMSSPSTAIV